MKSRISVPRKPPGFLVITSPENPQTLPVYLPVYIYKGNSVGRAQRNFHKEIFALKQTFVVSARQIVERTNNIRTTECNNRPYPTILVCRNFFNMQEIILLTPKIFYALSSKFPTMWGK